MPTHLPRFLAAVLLLTVAMTGAGRIDPPEGLPQARAKFETKLVSPGTEPSGEPPATPPNGTFDRIKYKSPAGELWAYLTPDPKDGKKHAAIIVCQGGFGGIGSSNWTVKRFCGHFRDAGLVVMVPSYRGQLDNPGKVELFHGEIDDVLAALKHLQDLPYVDASRIYITGHSTGGTMAMLAALSTDKLRAAFPLGGSPDVAELVDSDYWKENIPFDRASKDEAWIRSPISFVESLKTPMFYFEGSSSAYPKVARKMEKRAKAAGTPFVAFEITGGNHFDIVDPINELIARKIGEDTGAKCSIEFTQAEVQARYERRSPAISAPAIEPKGAVLRMTKRAEAKFRKLIADGKYDKEKQSLRLAIDEGLDLHLSIIDDGEISPSDKTYEMGGATFVIGPLTLAVARGILIDYDEVEGFIFANPNER